MGSEWQPQAHASAGRSREARKDEAVFCALNRGMDDVAAAATAVGAADILPQLAFAGQVEEEEGEHNAEPTAMLASGTARAQPSSRASKSRRRTLAGQSSHGGSQLAMDGVSAESGEQAMPMPRPRAADWCVQAVVVCERSSLGATTDTPCSLVYYKQGKEEKKRAVVERALRSKGLRLADFGMQLVGTELDAVAGNQRQQVL